MSHVATVEVQIKDLAALKKACERLGLEFKENCKTYKWYGRFMNDYAGSNAAFKHGLKPEDYGKCEHAVAIPGDPTAYECGVVKRPDGNGYTLIWDFYGCNGQRLLKRIGKDGKKLRQAYTGEVAAAKLSAKGFKVTWQPAGADKIKVVGVKA